MMYEGFQPSTQHLIWEISSRRIFFEIARVAFCLQIFLKSVENNRNWNDRKWLNPFRYHNRACGVDPMLMRAMFSIEVVRRKCSKLASTYGFGWVISLTKSANPNSRFGYFNSFIIYGYFAKLKNDDHSNIIMPIRLTWKRIALVRTSTQWCIVYVHPLFCNYGNLDS